MKTVRSIIDDLAKDHAEKLFLFSTETQLSMNFFELKNHAIKIEALLHSMGIEKGDKVAFLLPNGYWSATLLISVMYSGRVIVPLNAVSGDSALNYVIEHSETRAIFTDAHHQQKFSRVLNNISNNVKIIPTDINTGPEINNDALAEHKQNTDINSEDIAILMYTSGTTGQPKGVLLSHGNAIAGGNNTATAHELTENDRTLCVLPLYHINAQMVSIMAPLVTGGSVVMTPKFSTSVFWQIIADYQCTWFSVVPTIIAYLLEHAEREGFDKNSLGGLPHLKFGRSASAPLAPEMHKAFEQLFGVPIIETMGLTETSAQILSNPMPPAKPKYGSPGVAVGNQAKIINELGQECPRGTSGELMIKGNNVTLGYLKNPKATEDALASDGWLHTGDVAYEDEDGFFFITGRIKELIIKGGENIAPREIDEALYDHPSVLEAAGFGIPDPRYGQEIMACVALKPGTQCNEEELSELLLTKLGAYKSPKRIYFMDGLPKGPSGKIQRLKLPDMVEGI